jgi:glycosyltransferase involved in cell wall biosynthesis
MINVDKMESDMEKSTNKDKVTISVIVPAYNVEHYLASAMASLFAQTVPFDDIIIVDDGSSDGTGALVDSYRDLPGVSVFHTSNQGQGSARNFGLAKASGDYVYFFDADDLLDPGFVAAMQVHLVSAMDFDIVYFSATSFLDPGCSSQYLPKYDRKIDMAYDSGIAATGAMLRRDGYFASPCLYLSKSALWRDHRLAFLPIVHEDEEIIMRLSCAAGASLCVRDVFFQRRIREESTMTLPKSQRNALGYLNTLESIALYCHKNRQRVAPIRADLERRFYNILRGYMALCKAIGARPQYRKLGALLVKLGRPPGLRQCYEMGVPSALHARISQIKRKLCN